MKTILSVKPVKNQLKTFFLLLVGILIIHAASANSVYVDCKAGNDTNSGTIDTPLQTIHKAMEQIKDSTNTIYTIKVNPGIYNLPSHLTVETDKNIIGKHVTIEASILPCDDGWTPEKMPVITSSAMKGEFDKHRWVVAFWIDESNVTIRGLKFMGYSYPNTQYFPIARYNKQASVLNVEQCMFVAEREASGIQVGVIAHGDSVKVNHCVFYNANNAVVYFYSSNSLPKKGNSMTNCLVYGASESAIWLADPDSDFNFENNIISKCRFAWIQNNSNKTIYTLKNSVINNNENFTGNNNLKPTTITINEENILKEKDIELQYLKSIFQNIPSKHLHVKQGTFGDTINAGIFKPTIPDFFESQNYQQEEIILYPNPGSDLVQIQQLGKKKPFTKYQVLAMNGKIVQEQNLLTDFFSISSLKSGNYMVRLISKNHEPIIKTLIIKR